MSRILSRRHWLQSATVSAAALAVTSRQEQSLMADDSSNLRIVDSHVHVWKNDLRFPWPADLKEPPKEEATAEMLLSQMRQHGVERTVIVHVIYYRWDCRYSAAAVQAHRQQFMGVCRVDPQSPTADKELDHWVAEGLRGVRLSPAAGPAGDWINNEKQMDMICRRASELRVPVCFLCSISRIPDVERVIARHRERLDVCIDHMSDCPIDQPAELQKLLALARYPRVYVKLSHLWLISRQEYPYRDTHDQVRKLYDAFGPQRLMWGTDWPVVEQYCGYGRALALYRDEIKFFNDEDRRWILGETALRLWPAVS